MKFNKICVLGLGYIGLPTASTFATHGIKVVGVDTNPNIIETLKNGQLHLHEPGLRTLVQAALRSGNLTISQEPEFADAFIIAVPTPFNDNKDADLGFVKAAAEMIASVLQKGNLVILESTSPPRTTIDIVAPILERSGLNAGGDFHLAYSPERVLPGQILRELIENARVIGGIDPLSSEAGCDLYGIFVRGDIILTDATSAEMVKLMENTYRDVNIAVANEFSRLAEHFGIDVWEAINIANRHPRVNILNPGPGVGGHCISVDPWFLASAAPDITPLIQTARGVNDSQPEFVVARVKQILGEDLSHKTISVLGLTYKPDVDDMRESPAIEVVHSLQQEKATVVAYEPFKDKTINQDIQFAESLDEALEDSDLLLLLVAHSTFKSLNPQEVAGKIGEKKVLDTVNLWDSAAWQKAGFAFFKLGVGRTLN